MGRNNANDGGGEGVSPAVATAAAVVVGGRRTRARRGDALPYSPNEEAQRRRENRSLRRLTRLGQVREQERRRSMEKLRAYQRSRREGHAATVRDAKMDWDSKQRARLGSLRGDFRSALVSIGSAHRAAETATQAVAGRVERANVAREDAAAASEGRFVEAAERELSESAWANERRRVEGVHQRAAAVQRQSVEQRARAHAWAKSEAAAREKERVAAEIEAQNKPVVNHRQHVMVCQSIPQSGPSVLDFKNSRFHHTVIRHNTLNSTDHPESDARRPPGARGGQCSVEASALEAEVRVVQAAMDANGGNDRKSDKRVVNTVASGTLDEPISAEFMDRHRERAAQAAQTRTNTEQEREGRAHERGKQALFKESQAREAKRVESELRRLDVLERKRKEGRAGSQAVNVVCQQRQLTDRARKQRQLAREFEKIFLHRQDGDAGGDDDDNDGDDNDGGGGGGGGESRTFFSSVRSHAIQREWDDTARGDEHETAAAGGGRAGGSSALPAWEVPDLRGDDASAPPAETKPPVYYSSTRSNAILRASKNLDEQQEDDGGKALPSSSVEWEPKPQPRPQPKPKRSSSRAAAKAGDKAKKQTASVSFSGAAQEAALREMQRHVDAAVGRTADAEDAERSRAALLAERKAHMESVRRQHTTLQQQLALLQRQVAVGDTSHAHSGIVEQLAMLKREQDNLAAQMGATPGGGESEEEEGGDGGSISSKDEQDTINAVFPSDAVPRHHSIPGRMPTPDRHGASGSRRDSTRFARKQSFGATVGTAAEEAWERAEMAAAHFVDKPRASMPGPSSAAHRERIDKMDHREFAEMDRMARYFRGSSPRQARGDAKQLRDSFTTMSSEGGGSDDDVRSFASNSTATSTSRRLDEALDKLRGDDLAFGSATTKTPHGQGIKGNKPNTFGSLVPDPTPASDPWMSASEDTRSSGTFSRTDTEEDLAATQPLNRGGREARQRMEEMASQDLERRLAGVGRPWKPHLQPQGGSPSTTSDATSDVSSSPQTRREGGENELTQRRRHDEFYTPPDSPPLGSHRRHRAQGRAGMADSERVPRHHSIIETGSSPQRAGRGRGLGQRRERDATRSSRSRSRSVSSRSRSRERSADDASLTSDDSSVGAGVKRRRVRHEDAAPPAEHSYSAIPTPTRGQDDSDDQLAQAQHLMGDIQDLASAVGMALPLPRNYGSTAPFNLRTGAVDPRLLRETEGAEGGDGDEGHAIAAAGRDEGESRPPVEERVAAKAPHGDQRTSFDTISVHSLRDSIQAMQEVLGAPPALEVPAGSETNSALPTRSPIHFADKIESDQSGSSGASGFGVGSGGSDDDGGQQAGDTKGETPGEEKGPFHGFIAERLQRLDDSTDESSAAPEQAGCDDGLPSSPSSRGDDGDAARQILAGKDFFSVFDPAAESENAREDDDGAKPPMPSTPASIGDESLTPAADVPAISEVVGSPAKAQPRLPAAAKREMDSDDKAASDDDDGDDDAKAQEKQQHKMAEGGKGDGAPTAKSEKPYVGSPPRTNFSGRSSYPSFVDPENEWEEGGYGVDEDGSDGDGKDSSGGGKDGDSDDGAKWEGELEDGKDDVELTRSILLETSAMGVSEQQNSSGTHSETSVSNLSLYDLIGHRRNSAAGESFSGPLESPHHLDASSTTLENDVGHAEELTASFLSRSHERREKGTGGGQANSVFRPRLDELEHQRQLLQQMASFHRKLGISAEGEESGDVVSEVAEEGSLAACQDSDALRTDAASRGRVSPGRISVGSSLGLQDELSMFSMSGSSVASHEEEALLRRSTAAASDATSASERDEMSVMAAAATTPMERLPWDLTPKQHELGSTREQLSENDLSSSSATSLAQEVARQHALLEANGILAPDMVATTTAVALDEGDAGLSFCSLPPPPSASSDTAQGDQLAASMEEAPLESEETLVASEAGDEYGSDDCLSLTGVEDGRLGEGAGSPPPMIVTAPMSSPPPYFDGLRPDAACHKGTSFHPGVMPTPTTSHRLSPVPPPASATAGGMSFVLPPPRPPSPPKVNNDVNGEAVAAADDAVVVAETFFEEQSLPSTGDLSEDSLRTHVQPTLAEAANGSVEDDSLSSTTTALQETARRPVRMEFSTQDERVKIATPSKVASASDETLSAAFLKSHPLFSAEPGRKPPRQRTTTPSSTGRARRVPVVRPRTSSKKKSTPAAAASPPSSSSSTSQGPSAELLARLSQKAPGSVTQKEMLARTRRLHASLPEEVERRREAEKAVQRKERMDQVKSADKRRREKMRRRKLSV